jgi:hypothetical protein
MSAENPVSLSRLVEDLTDNPHDWIILIDRTTGDVVAYSHDGDGPWGEGEDWEARWTRYRKTGEGFACVRDVGDRFCDDADLIPSFCRDVPQGAALAEAFNGNGAYRKFRKAIADMGLEKQWEAYRKERVAEEARDWLQSEGIPFTDDLPPSGSV